MKIPATWTESEVITTPASPSTSSPSTPNKPLETKPQQQQRCLRFAPEVTVYEIPNLEEYTPQEKFATWFQALDYEEFRENCYMTMGLYRAGLLEDNKHTMRGLEHRLSDVSRVREWTRYHATSAVLQEQYQQYRQFGYNALPQIIADRYHAISWKSQYTAYSQAMVDEQEQLVAVKPPSSPRKSVLRKVIDIERTTTTTSSMDTSCAMQLSFPAGNATADFDINSFFADMSISAQ